MELKRYFLDSQELISYAGFQYLFLVFISVTFVSYATLEKQLNLGISINSAVIFIISSTYTMYNGQKYQDAWEEFYEALCSMPWYTWSRKNQEFYYTIILGARKNTQVVMLNNVSINYDLLLKVSLEIRLQHFKFCV
ncbi:hypothetical protein ABEB36_000898 [Hypothenemus hampei]|uniref:Uncharacterized protein n=1 Tax=Hypothenemus hampei TaxID=57062 RepID=A0ABD1FCX0_HYPHA